MKEITKLNTEEKLEVAKKFILAKAITDEDMKQDLYLAALEFEGVDNPPYTKEHEEVDLLEFLSDIRRANEEKESRRIAFEGVHIDIPPVRKIKLSDFFEDEEEEDEELVLAFHSLFPDFFG